MTMCYSNYETIVVDCGSEDGSAKMIIDEFPSVKLVNAPKMGISEALNLGISEAKGDFLLLELNSDDLVDSNFLKSLVGASLNIRCADLVCGKRLAYEKSIIDSTGGKIDMLTGLAPSLGRGKPDSFATNNIMEVDYAGVYLVKKEVLQTIGKFDKDYYIYFEDTDFCYRAKLYGFKMFYVPNALVWHKGSSTVKYRSFRYQYYMRRNNYRFIIKNYPLIFMATALYFQFILSTLFCLSFIVKSRLDLVLCEANSIKWNFSNFRKIVHVRLYQKNLIFAFKKSLEIER